MLQPMDGSPLSEANVPEDCMACGVLRDEQGRHYVYQRFANHVPLFEQVQVADIVANIAPPVPVLTELAKAVLQHDRDHGTFAGADRVMGRSDAGQTPRERELWDATGRGRDIPGLDEIERANQRGRRFEVGGYANERSGERDPREGLTAIPESLKAGKSVQVTGDALRDAMGRVDEAERNDNADKPTYYGPDLKEVKAD